MPCCAGTIPLRKYHYRTRPYLWAFLLGKGCAVENSRYFFSLKLQRNNQQSALTIFRQWEKLDKNPYVHRVMNMKQTSTVIEPF